jgi:hypothetical protein
MRCHLLFCPCALFNLNLMNAATRTQHGWPKVLTVMGIEKSVPKQSPDQS